MVIIAFRICWAGLGGGLALSIGAERCSVARSGMLLSRVNVIGNTATGRHCSRWLHVCPVACSATLAIIFLCVGIYQHGTLTNLFAHILQRATSVYPAQTVYSDLGIVDVAQVGTGEASP